MQERDEQQRNEMVAVPSAEILRESLSRYTTIDRNEIESEVSILMGYSATEHARSTDRLERRDQSEVFFTDASFWLWMAGALVLVGLLYFARLGDTELWGPEGRWAEIAREMDLNPDYFRPTINGQVYYDKPLLSYWLVVGASYVTGGFSETAARLPSAVAGFVGVALIMLLGRRLYGTWTALLAGLILGTSYYYVSFSRIASADMETVVGVLGCLVIFHYCCERPKGWWVVGLWLLMAVTSLTKGLLGFVLPLLVLGVYSLLNEGWGELLRWVSEKERFRWIRERLEWLLGWRGLLAALIGAGVYCLPFAISSLLMGSDTGISLVFHENVVRYFHPFDHRGPVYLYVWAIFVLMAPWSVFLPAALVWANIRVRNKSDRFVLIYFWTIFIFFTLSGSRRDYYLLPILPAAALLIARVFSVGAEVLDRRISWLLAGGYLLLVVTVVGLGATALLPVAWRPEGLEGSPVLPEWWVFVLFWVLMLVSVCYALRGMEIRRLVLACGVAAFLMFGYLFLVALPWANSHPGEKAFARAVRSELRGDLSRLATYRIRFPSLLFYLAPKQPLLTFSEEKELVQYFRKHPDLYIILSADDLAAFPLRGSIRSESERFYWRRSPHWSAKYVLLRPADSVKAEKQS